MMARAALQVRAWALGGLCALVVLASGCATPRTPRAGAPSSVDAPVQDAKAGGRRDPGVVADAPATAVAPDEAAPTKHAGAAEKAAAGATATSTATPEPLDDGAAVFSALRAQLQTTGCSSDRVVQRWVANYARSPARFAANLERVLPLLAHVVAQVRAAGLPGEFALLPIVESWYRPDARNGGTVGLWQFSAATARGNGLRVDSTLDQRFAPGPSTQAALAHLAYLHAHFSDWRLAVMAFNAGEFRLRRAHANDPSPPSPQAHQPAGLTLTTYEHLAKLLALACLVRHPDSIGLELPTVAFEPLDADVLGTAVAHTAVNGVAASGSAARVHVVRSGDSLWAIARRHGTTVARLLGWNGLAADAVLKPGQRIRLHP